jgi:hypothetical protein
VDGAATWVLQQARSRGRESELRDGRLAFALGLPRPDGRWQRLGWEDASMVQLRRDRCVRT